MWIRNFLLIVISLSISSFLYANSGKMRPTLVLVHGALLTSSIWAPVQSYLQNHHYNVVTLDVPGRLDDEISAQDADINLAAKKVCDVAQMQHGAVILVGHSQAGAVNNQALAECAKDIKALVYIAAVVPLNGEKPYDLLSQSDGENFDKCTTLDTEKGVYQINYSGPIKEMFMDDGREESVARAISDMVPEPIIIGEKTLHFSNEVFEAMSKFYIETTKDRIISPTTQKKILARTKFTQIYTLQTSHSPFLSQPKELGKMLSDIANRFSESN